MPCEMLTTPDSPVQIIACGPPRRYRRFYGNCEVCKARTAHVRRWDGMYYGYSEICMRCRNLWMDGAITGEPSRKRGREWWNTAEPAAQFDAWVAETERSYFEDIDDEYEVVEDDDEWHDGFHPHWVEGCDYCLDRANRLEEEMGLS